MGFAPLVAGLGNYFLLALKLIGQLAARNFFLRLNAFLFFGDILLNGFELRLAVVGAVRGGGQQQGARAEQAEGENGQACKQRGFFSL